MYGNKRRICNLIPGLKELKRSLPFKTVDEISKNSRTDYSLSDGIDRSEKWHRPFTKGNFASVIPMPEHDKMLVFNLDPKINKTLSFALDFSGCTFQPVSGDSDVIKVTSLIPTPLQCGGFVTNTRRVLRTIKTDSPHHAPLTSDSLSCIKMVHTAHVAVLGNGEIINCLKVVF